MSCPDWRHLDPAVRDAPHGSAAGGPGSAGAAGAASWEEALRHLDSGCRLCRREALAADPTLAFRHLPPVEMTAADEAREVELARRAVTAMRAARRLDRHAPLPLADRADRADRHARRARRSPAAGAWRGHGLRWALAAGLTGLALLTGAEHGWRGAGALGSHPTRDALNGSRLAAPASAAAGLTAGASGTRGAAAADAADTADTANAAEITGGAGLAGAGRVLPPDLAAVPAANRSSIEGFSRPEARVYQIDGPHMSVVMIVDDKLDV